jgi:hypothetical protein
MVAFMLWNTTGRAWDTSKSSLTAKLFERLARFGLCHDSSSRSEVGPRFSRFASGLGFWFGLWFCELVTKLSMPKVARDRLKRAMDSGTIGGIWNKGISQFQEPGC